MEHSIQRYTTVGRPGRWRVELVVAMVLFLERMPDETGNAFWPCNRRGPFGQPKSVPLRVTRNLNLPRQYLLWMSLVFPQIGS